MARAEKRRNLGEQGNALRAAILELRHERDELKRENKQLRDAARQLMAGLTEYAKVENWHEETSVEPGGKKTLIWLGEGEGPAVARKFLGLEDERN